MIHPDRFIVESLDEDSWHAARRGGVSATKVAEAATPSGFEKALHPEEPIDDNPYMQFGRDAETIIGAQIKATHGLMPNRWLIASDEDPAYLATPDMLSLDHTVIGEIKTVGEKTAWEPRNGAVPIKYRRQVQFQLFVTGAEACLFAWNVRVEDGQGWFYLKHIEPMTLWFERDDAMIADLRSVADRLLEAKGLVNA